MSLPQLVLRRRCLLGLLLLSLLLWPKPRVLLLARTPLHYPRPPPWLFTILSTAVS